MKSLEFILDMVHNNPGEAPFVSKYNDPAYLRSQGFNGSVMHLHLPCSVLYDRFEQGILPEGTDDRDWIVKKALAAEERIRACAEQGIAVYPFTDFLVLPRLIWEKYGDQIAFKGAVEIDNTGGFAERARKPDIGRPLTQKLLLAQIEEFFDRFPLLAGITLRFGETYLHDAPYHCGGSPIRPGEDGIADHVTLLNLLREEICVKRDKKLFYRTWDFGYHFHNNPDYYLSVTDQIEPHPNLIFSIKHQQDDYHRMTPFNPCLGVGKHRQIVETPTQLDSYGKGTHAYYSTYGILNGWPETTYKIRFGTHDFTGELNDPSEPRGVKDILDRGLLCGIMTWSRGGGWEGPYLAHEFWIDLNTYVMTRWAQDPARPEEELFYEFAAGLGLTGYAADLFRQLNLLTIEGVRKAQLNSFVTNNVWWARDHYFSVLDNKEVIQQILDAGKMREVLAEKAEASAIWRQIEALSRQITVRDPVIREVIEVTSVYGRIKTELMEQMWVIMLVHAVGERSGEYDKVRLAAAVRTYDELWQEWRELKEKSPYCATLYTDLAFGPPPEYQRNLREGSIGELVDLVRERIGF